MDSVRRSKRSLEVRASISTTSILLISFGLGTLFVLIPDFGFSESVLAICLGCSLFLIAILVVFDTSWRDQQNFLQRMRKMAFPQLLNDLDEITSFRNRLLLKFMAAYLVMLLLVLGTRELAEGISIYALAFVHGSLVMVGWELELLLTRGYIWKEKLRGLGASAWQLTMAAMVYQIIKTNPENTSQVIMFCFTLGLVPFLLHEYWARSNKIKRMAGEGDLEGLLAVMLKWGSFKAEAAEGLGLLAENGRVKEIVSGNGVELLVNYVDRETMTWEPLKMIAEAGERDHVVCCILKALNSHSPEMRFHAARLLGDLEEPSVIPELEKLFDQDKEFPVIIPGKVGLTQTSVSSAAREAVGKLRQLEKRKEKGPLDQPLPEEEITLRDPF